jgi:voltage-gated potassium channel
MLALCVYSLTALAVDAFVSLPPSTREILGYADTGVCFLFFADFVGSLVRASNRWRYLYTWGWIDLASSIPAVSALRWGRAVRIIRIVRVLRAVRSVKHLSSFVLAKRAEGTLLAAVYVSLLLVLFSSIAILQFEVEPESNIKNAGDAIWWSFVTVTTVGYGDKYPITAEGRVLAGVLMTAGIGLFGTFSGFVAAWFLKPEEQQERSDIDRMREELAEIKRLVLATGRERGPDELGSDSQGTS